MLTKEVNEYEGVLNKNKEVEFQSVALNIKNYDALKQELLHFHNSIVKNKVDENNAKNAIKALEVAKEINHIIKQN